MGSVVGKLPGVRVVEVFQPLFIHRGNFLFAPQVWETASRGDACTW